jgi:DNA-binding NarL/FixJ family response regulator
LRPRTKAGDDDRVHGEKIDVRILMIDDHALFRDGMRMLLHQFSPEAELLEASGCEEVLRGRNWSPPDLVLLDLGLPGLGGIEGVRSLHRLWPEARIVVVSGVQEVETIQTAIGAGASGYILKTANAQEMLGTLRLVDAGGVSVPAHARAVITKSDVPELTPRQKQVLDLLVRGLANRRIADELGMAESTVRGHVSELLAVLGARNRTEAARIAFEQGLGGRSSGGEIG